MKRFGLIGERLGHSFSKTIHERLGLYAYDLLEVSSDDLALTLANTEFSGFNVTIPYKLAVISHCAELSDEAREVGSVNTILRRGDGSLFGHNTDLAGFLAMVERAGILLANMKVLILGSGGTSLTAQAAARRGGAREIVVVSRLGEVKYSDIYKHSDAEIIINTTPVGMFPNTDESAISLDLFCCCRGVVDVIYNPLKTRLLLEAEERGIPCVSGLYMLVAQAIFAAELFTGAALGSYVEQVFGELQCAVQSIALIGMPGSGKTTVGRALAVLTGRSFLDTDELLVERAGMSIPAIFELFGEPHFRELEREIVAECSKISGIVMSTGGGAPLLPENKHSLRQNSRVYLIERQGKLETEGRPLSKDSEALRKMALQRKPFYESCADSTVENNASPEDTARRILEEYYEAACH